MHLLKPLVALAVIHTKAVVLLLTHCLFQKCSHCGGSVFGPCFVMHFLVSFLVLQSFCRKRELHVCASHII